MNKSGMAYHLWRALGTILRGPPDPPAFTVVRHREQCDLPTSGHVWQVEERGEEYVRACYRNTVARGWCHSPFISSHNRAGNGSIPSPARCEFSP